MESKPHEEKQDSQSPNVEKEEVKAGDVAPKIIIGNEI